LAGSSTISELEGCGVRY